MHTHQSISNLTLSVIMLGGVFHLFIYLLIIVICLVFNGGLEKQTFKYSCIINKIYCFQGITLKKRPVK